MTRKKSVRIEQIKTFENVLEFPEDLKGKWQKDFFKNNNPIIAELGCGKGEYSLALAERFPDKNILGVDAKGTRLWKAARTALDAGLTNAGFLRFYIENISQYFEKDELSEIWITFPDPYPKPSKAQKRMVSPRFINAYRQVLKPGGILHFKTDNEALFQFGLDSLKAEDCEIIAQSFDLYNSELVDDLTSIKTSFERKFLNAGLTIKYARFRVH